MTRPELPAPTVDGEGYWSWDHMVRQFPKRGPVGMTYERKEHVLVAEFPGGDLTTVCDTLAYRNRKGRVVGIVSRWPDEVRLVDVVLERAGAVSVWVDPTRRRRGIGMLLVAEVDRRWGLDLSVQSFTQGGHALVSKYLDERDRHTVTDGDIHSAP